MTFLIPWDLMPLNQKSITTTITGIGETGDGYMMLRKRRKDTNHKDAATHVRILTFQNVINEFA